MTTVEWSKFSQKVVTDSDGIRIGHVSDVKVDSRGNITEVQVTDSNPNNRETPYTQYERVEGVYHIPISAVQAVKDQLIVK